MDRHNLMFLLDLVSSGLVSKEVGADIIDKLFIQGTPTEIKSNIGRIELNTEPGTKLLNNSDPNTRGLLIKDWVSTIRKIQLGANSEFKLQTIRNKTATYNHICFLYGSMPLAELKPMRITADLKSIASSNPTKAQRILAELKSIYAEAMANQLVDTNPALHVKNIRYKVKRKRLEFSTWKLMVTYAKHNKEYWVYCMLLLALTTGQRRADLAKLKFSDVRDGYLHIEQQKQAGKGYGARVAIPLDLKINGLRLSLGDIIEKCKGYGRPGMYLLCSSTGKPLEISSLSIQFRECLKGVVNVDQVYKDGESPSLHEVRSLSARKYKEQGIDTQTLLGHKNADMTSLYEDDRGLTAKEYKKVKL